MTVEGGVNAGQTELCLFARPPELGRVKRRLARDVGADEALRTYLELAEATLARLHDIPAVRSCLWVAENPAHPTLRGWSRRWCVPLRNQCPGDLGRRMDHALRQSLVGADRVLLVGMDIPLLTASYVTRAVRALADADLVFGPVEDGGYGLVGVRAPQPALFRDIPWGSAGVLDASLAVARRLQLRTVLLDTLWDVDDGEDWYRYRALPPR